MEVSETTTEKVSIQQTKYGNLVACYTVIFVMFLSSHQDLDLDHRKQPFLWVLGFVPMGFGQVITRIDCAFMYAFKYPQILYVTMCSHCKLLVGNVK